MIKSIWKVTTVFLDWFIPRFITEDVICYKNAQGVFEADMTYDLFVYIYESYDNIRVPDAVVKVQSFNLFGVGYFGKAVNEPISYQQFLKERK